MKILHTSDWHLGRTLYGKKRYDEFAMFLDWLSQTITTYSIDTLLIAGDVFDTTTPSNQAQSLYYEFLCRISQSNCKHVVIIAGNHDSPSFLTAPKEILKRLNVHIVGMKSDEPLDEIILLEEEGTPKAIICAVPYLRDKDIRLLEPGESIDDKNTKLVAGLKSHYHSIADAAETLRNSFTADIAASLPIIAMGHLFASGGKTADGDGVRELYVGSLAHVGVDIFSPIFDYVALGHLHVPQLVSGMAHIRYSGSPIPMGFGEATQEKEVIIIEFDKKRPDITAIKIPTFQALIRIKGDMPTIIDTITGLKQSKKSIWLEIEYTGKDVMADMRSDLEALLLGSELEIRRIKNRLVFDRVLQQQKLDESLDDLDEFDIFQRCLDAYEIAIEDRPMLEMLYQTTLKTLNEQDNQAK